MKTVISIAIGGALGALSRFAVSKLFNLNTFNMPTFIINTSGCFMLGLIVGFTLNKNINNWILDGLIIGFLGAYTTYSAFTLESFNIMQNLRTP